MKRVEKEVEIKEVLLEFSDLFSPPLTEKMDMETYPIKLRDNAIVLSEPESGFAVVYANDPKGTAFIPFIGVKGTKQGQGVGNKLMNALVEQTQKNGMNKIKLEVRENNEKAIKFYKSNGFVHEGESESNSYYMVKELD